jgi:hypothetical protein
VTRLSVIVISLNDVTVLAQCLAALRDQVQATGAELLVVRRGAEQDAACATLRREQPHVTWIEPPAGATIPQQRSLGVCRSRGEIVGLLEDDCVANPGWCAAAIAAHDGVHNAIGGAIAPGDYTTGLDWAVFFCEYGRFLPPQAGVVPILPGTNVTYRRTALTDVDLQPGLYEVFLHQQWQAAGQELLADPGLLVKNVNHWSGSRVLRSAYHHGRTFAAMRVEGKPGFLRLIYGALAPLLPLVQTTRIARNVLAHRDLRSVLLSALPWIVAFTGSWAWGEWHGYWFGPGVSAGRWQ